MNFLNEALYGEDSRKYCVNQEWACIWADKSVKTPYIGQIDRVYISGIVI